MTRSKYCVLAVVVALEVVVEVAVSSSHNCSVCCGGRIHIEYNGKQVVAAVVAVGVEVAVARCSCSGGCSESCSRLQCLVQSLHPALESVAMRDLSPRG